jgi:hypothetical protein
MFAMCFVCAGAVADTSDFLLVRRSLQVQNIRLVEINDQTLTHFEQGRPGARIPLGDCIALINPIPPVSASRSGVLILTNGQRIPGEPSRPAADDNSADTFGWTHPWLGHLNVPINSIHAVLLNSTEFDPTSGAADTVLLTNGDRLEGLVTELGKAVVVEPLAIDGAEVQAATTIPLDRVASIVLVTPRTAGTGRRIWFGDGTVLDVQSIALSDDMYIRLSGGDPGIVTGTQVPRIGIADIAAVLFDPKGLVPLASIAPSRVEGPATRYIVPRPRVIEPDAPVGLSPIELRGPVVVRYSLPSGAIRFAAQAVLPDSARQWGDLELIVRSDDAEVFRMRLNAESPTGEINVALAGRELTLELTAGAHGPIQDQVILNRAMILLKR